MKAIMRTTIRMDQELLKEAKAYAAKIGLSLTTMIEEGLRLRLKFLSKKTKEKMVHLPVFKGNGLKTGLNLSSNAQIQDFLDHS